MVEPHEKQQAWMAHKDTTDGSCKWISLPRESKGCLVDVRQSFRYRMTILRRLLCWIQPLCAFINRYRSYVLRTGSADRKPSGQPRRSGFAGSFRTSCGRWTSRVRRVGVHILARYRCWTITAVTCWCCSTFPTAADKRYRSSWRAPSVAAGLQTRC
jgi:hypothetical protein